MNLFVRIVRDKVLCEVCAAIEKARARNNYKNRSVLSVNARIIGQQSDEHKVT
jgi:hypothetical protein